MQNAFFPFRNSQNEISLKIYDVAGRVMKSFNHLTNFSFNQIVWDAFDDSGRKLPAGVYFVRLETGEFSMVKKVIFLR
ncbi:MAG: T9SS type A sorting domain-containing protein [candidate division WOR-3 bacterium]